MTDTQVALIVWETILLTVSFGLGVFIIFGGLFFVRSAGTWFAAAGAVTAGLTGLLGLTAWAWAPLVAAHLILGTVAFLGGER